mmetsp:Transcript_34392/g.109849  ORF Transcript_34392/g.109849 Transcript_34392/m.109849 type:complete len:290 (-) Transcript_34392:230-1099(-)
MLDGPFGLEGIGPGLDKLGELGYTRIVLWANSTQGLTVTPHRDDVPHHSAPPARRPRGGRPHLALLCAQHQLGLRPLEPVRWRLLHPQDGCGPPPLLPGRTPEDGRRGAGPRGPGAPPHHGRLARHDCPGREGAPLRPIPQPAARHAHLRRLVQLGPPGAAIPARALPALRLPAQPVQPARPGVAQLPLPRTIRRTDHDARAALHGALCEHRPGQVRRHHRRGRPPRLEHRPGRGAGHLPSRVRQRKELRGAPRVPRDAPRVGGDDQGRAAPAPARASCEPARQAVCIA